MPDRFTTLVERCCRHCGRTAGQTSEQILRVQGWRIYSGTSLTGKEISDTVCPWCAGTATTPAPGWRVGCHTCDWEFDEKEDGEGPLTSQKEADQLARDHECEKWTWTKPPPVAAPQAVATASLLGGTS
jgi:hypothetical protein